MVERLSQAEWVELVPDSKRHFFLRNSWEKLLQKTYSYIKIENLNYKDNFLVRVAIVGDRITSVPFSDGGDVISIDGRELVLDDLQKDLIDFYSTEVNIHAHEYFCPVVNKEADIVDFKIKLKAEDEMVREFRKTLRHVLSDVHAQHISLCVSEDELRQSYKIYLQTMRRAKNLSMSFDLFKKLDGEMFVWKDGGRVEGFSLFVGDQNKKQYTLSGTTHKGKGQNVAHHLLWYAMRFYSKAGVKDMFLGGTRKDSPLLAFKRGWRGEEYLIFSSNSATSKEKTRNSALRSLWRFLPLSLTPPLSKILGKKFF